MSGIQPGSTRAPYSTFIPRPVRGPRSGSDPGTVRGSDPGTVRRGQIASVLDINTLDRDGKPQFIHSGTYEELIEAFGLTAQHIASAVMGALKARGSR